MNILQHVINHTYVLVIVKEDESFFVQFLSGELYDAASNEWSSVEIPFSSFNIGSYNGKVVLGVAQMEGSEMVGDKQVMRLDEVTFESLSNNYL